MKLFDRVKKGWTQRYWMKSYFCQRIKGDIGKQLLENVSGPVDLIISIANHFEPQISRVGLEGAVASMRKWCEEQESVLTRDSDGIAFKHTYYFPAEQYRPELLKPLEYHCKTGFGEVEIHLHHGLKQPDNTDSLRGQLLQFISNLKEHGFLSYDIRDPNKRTRYCFVHGNWALANSGRGKFCGVDDEMMVLSETGCYMDCTLPSAPDISQVSKINSIYECGLPLEHAIPHRNGKDLRVGGKEPKFPFLLQGPLLIYLKKRRKGLFFPGIENGAIDDYNPPTIDRFRLWISANIHVKDCPNWVFIKLHTHGLQDDHSNSIRGPVMKQFLHDIMEDFNDGKKYRLHFTTSRESANIILAAVDGKRGNPNQYRDYRFRLFDS